MAALAGLDPLLGVELARTVIEDRVGLGQLVALPLAGDHVQEHGTAHLTQVLQRRQQRIEVVAVDRTEVVEAELLEQRRRHQHALGMPFEPAGQFVERRDHRQHLAGDVTGPRQRPRRKHAREVAIERADGRRYRHVVVVEHHQQIDVGRDAGVVQRLEGHPRAHRAVTDHGHVTAPVGAFVLALRARRHGHPECRRDRRRRMRRAERVVLALDAAGKAGNAAELAQPCHLLAPAGQDLVRVRLMTDVPDDPVARRVEHVVKRDASVRPCPGSTTGAHRCGSPIPVRSDAVRRPAAAGRHDRGARSAAGSLIRGSRGVSGVPSFIGDGAPSSALGTAVISMSD